MNEDFTKIDIFVKKWNRKESPEHATNDNILNVENELKFILPKSYKYLITNYGNIYTTDILDAVVDNELGLNDIQNFELPEQALKDSISWQEAGMPAGFYAFASDCMGNMFCFKNSECQNENEEPPIWFFDHDFDETEKIAENLLSWLEVYNEM